MSPGVPIRGAEIIGAMTPARSQAPFNRAGLVVRGTTGVYVQVRAYTRDDAASGPTLEDDEWQALVTSGQVLVLPEHVPLVAGAALWILRHKFPRREQALHDLNASGALVRGHSIGEDDAWLCLIDESREAAARLRDRWRREAFAAAAELGRRDAWERAVAEAEVAQAVARGLDPEGLALLRLVYERCGRKTRAEGLLLMARRSRGDDFVQTVREHYERLSRLVYASRAAREPAAKPSWRRDVRERAARGVQRDLAFSFRKVAA